MKLFSITCILALLLCGCPPKTQYLDSPLPHGGEGHRESGISFPQRVGDLQRTRVVRYDKDGRDVSANYDSTDRLLRLFATVYVYPAPPLTVIGSPPEVVAQARSGLAEREFARNKLEILRNQSGAKLIEEREATHSEGGKTHHGAVAIYEYNYSFGGPEVPVRSYLYLFCNVDGKWSIKYRFTHPRDVDGTATIEEFLQSFKWKGE